MNKIINVGFLFTFCFGFCFRFFFFIFLLRHFYMWKGTTEGLRRDMLSNNLATHYENANFTTDVCEANMYIRDVVKKYVFACNTSRHLGLMLVDS